MQATSVTRSTPNPSSHALPLAAPQMTLGLRSKARKWTAAAALGALSVVALQANAQSQQLFKEVGPDGRVTFSDRPANAAAKETQPAGARAGAGGSGAGSLSEALPFELRTVVGKFPVTLYTSKDCAPCEEGRRLLSQRGVPFIERTVETESDGTQLQNLSGQNSLPVATIGSKRLIGYTQSDWDQYLTAAGYPVDSKLPPNYRRPAAQSLTPTPAATAQAAEAKQVAPEEAKARQPRPIPAAPSKPGGDNAAGIVF